jgi:hypothetical protein
MTTLQKAVKNALLQWDDDGWIPDNSIQELRKALANEQAQAVEPKLPELFNEIEWLGNEVRVHVFQRRADQTPLNVHSSTHPAPPATGESAELVAFLREITTTLQPAHHIKQKANAAADMLAAAQGDKP